MKFKEFFAKSIMPRFRVFNLLIFLFLFLTNSLFAQKSQVLPVDAFESGIQKSNSQLLDVRTIEEYKSGHLKNSLQADWYIPAQFTDRINHLDKKKPVFVYCLSGARSQDAMNLMIRSGFQEVYNLQDGFRAWKKSGKPVESDAFVRQISLAEYQKSIPASGFALVDFSAKWCPPCKVMEPVIDSFAKKNRKLFQLVKVNGAEQTEILENLNVSGFPTFIIYKNGKEIWRKSGISTEKELLQHLR